MSDRRDSSYLDQSILSAVRELTARLNLLDRAVEEVLWKDVVGTSRAPRVVPSDRCEFWPHKLVLPSRMRESLSLDEWRPIIASALVYRTLASKIARKRAPLLLVPLILF